MARGLDLRPRPRHRASGFIAAEREKSTFPGVQTGDQLSLTVGDLAVRTLGPATIRSPLTACLCTRRALPVPSARTRGRGKTFVSPKIMISQRPAEVADRAVPGPSMSTYARCTKPVLRRPVEPGLAAAVGVVHRRGGGGHSGVVAAAMTPGAAAAGAPR